MTVSTNVKVEDGHYVPFHTRWRGGPGGDEPVGSLAVDAGATGAAGGGTVSAGITMNAEEFGFRMIWIPTQIYIRDNLATAEDMSFSYEQAGNRRLNTNSTLRVLMTASAQSQNTGLVDGASIPIEPLVATTDGRCMVAIWDTNTDTKSYHLHVFGFAFDMELIARKGGIGPLMSGIR